LYKSIIDGLQKFKNPVKTIRLYGFGEPLINSRFCDMVKYAKASDRVRAVDTTTNASLLNYDLSDRLIESGIDRINISINGLKDAQYQDFTGCRVSVDNLIKNIEYLYSVRNDTVIFIKINGDNLADDERKLFYELFTPISSGCDIEYTMSCWYDCTVEKNNIVGVYGQPRENVNTCPYIFYSITVQAGGEVSACFLDWDKRIIVGDVKTTGIYEIWNSPALLNFRLNMLDGNKTAICQNCDQLAAGMPVNIDSYAAEIRERFLK
jgi:radical SAM protein with 4Fe4S-binding SPASM domain